MLTANEMLLKYSKKTAHANEVKRLALMIFNEISTKFKPMTDKHREYLEASCLLHDIGYKIDVHEHNKHSMNIIINEGLIGFNQKECEIIACICRYHRGGLPKKDKHEVYMDFEKQDRKLIKRLAGILKISDGLDRTEISLIKDIKMNFDTQNNIAEILLTPSNLDYYPDINCAIRKRDLFEIGFKLQTIIKFTTD